jgi:hypothetical protein
VYEQMRTMSSARAEMRVWRVHGTFEHREHSHFQALNFLRIRFDAEDPACSAARIRKAKRSVIYFEGRVNKNVRHRFRVIRPRDSNFPTSLDCRDNLILISSFFLFLSSLTRVDARAIRQASAGINSRLRRSMCRQIRNSDNETGNTELRNINR